MTRLFLWLAALAAAASGAAWMAYHQGSVTVHWLDYEIQTNVPLVIGALLFTVAGLIALHAIWREAWRVPSRLVGRFTALRQEEGIRALTAGFTAVAARDAKGARRYSDQARKLLSDQPISLLLAAYSADVDARLPEKTHYYRLLAEQPDTAFLGERGLLATAGERQDTEAMRRHAEAALKLRPDAGWLAELLVDLDLRDGRYKQARRMVDTSLKQRGLERTRATRLVGLIHDAEARALAARGSAGEALTLAKAAYEKLPDFPPVVVHYAQVLQHAGQAARALPILEKAWIANPHPELTDALLAAAAEAKSTRELQRLANREEHHPERAYLAAMLALEQREFEEARRVARGAAYPEATARAARLVAKIEATAGDDHAARLWLERALNATVETVWRCATCGTRHARWHRNCGHCHGFDTLSWHAPDTGRPVIEPLQALVPV